MQEHPVIIAGGGIGGLALALTLEQIGVHCRVIESARDMRPLGVGVNLQPNAVRELLAMGFTFEDLDSVGLPALEWALLGLNGKEVYSEPRGIDAGYHWPQYAVHRGEFHMLLYRKLLERVGETTVTLGTRVTGYEHQANGTVHVTMQSHDGRESAQSARLLIGADGIHSAVRAQMYPDQPPIHWGGAVMWRGTVKARAMRTQSSFIGLGTHRHRMVIYPISTPDSDGLSLVNWIAELTVDSSSGWQENGWFRPVQIADFIDHFADFKYDWLDVPAMLQQADCAYENPMIDRDPVKSWVDGSVALLGDAAHAMYPTGSNGASQAIVDARVLGAKIVLHGLSPDALLDYDDQLCEPVSQLVLRNREAGPFGLLNVLDDRCGGFFDDIEQVLPAHERAEFMAAYRQAAGLAIEKLNSSEPTIAHGARVSMP